MSIINGRHREYKLDNGLVVALQNTPTQTIATKLRVNYGSFHERDGEEGMAHFLEHCLVSGGSSKYNPETADEIRGTFGVSNASTSIGRTSFIGQMLSENFEAWMDYTSDHVFRPRFDQERVSGERERVLREISDHKSSPTYPVKLEFNSVFYRGHPKGRFTFGNEEVVRSAELSKIRAFHNKGYNPNNMDLIVVGNLPKDAEGIINKYFGSVPVGENTRRKFPELSSLDRKIVLHRQAPELVNLDNQEESSAQIFLHYLGPVDGHEDEYAVGTMNQILGGDTNSLLFHNVGLRKGLAYQVTTISDGSYNAGELGINASVPATRINEAVDAIFEEIQRMKTEIVSNKAVDRIKGLVKYNVANSFESNGGHVSAIERKIDEGLTPEIFIAGFDKITPESVMEVANKYLPDKENGDYLLYIRDPLKQ